MVPTYTNSSSPSFPFELNNNSDQVHLHHHDHLSSDHNNNNIIMNIPHVNPYNNYQFASSSSNSSSCQTFFNMSTTNIQDQRDNYTYHSQFHHPQHQHEVDNFGSRSGSHDHVEKKNKGIKLTFWKKGEAKMKNNLKLEDQKIIESTTDHSSNNSSSNNNIPIRVCSDCNTTKTPLWRSGPKGPKSLCNACGIRQRKARRAMAAAAAANGTNFTSSTTETSSTTTTTTMKIKVQQQQQKQKITKVNTNHVVPFKKRCKFLTTTTTTGPSSSPSPAPTSAPVRHHVDSSTLSSSSSSSSRQMKKLSFDDFYVDLSNNLGIHRVFPQDEKEAAILLMVLSSGLVHG